jgi:hypothetical protein
MAIIIRPVRGQVTQRALPQGPSMLRLAKVARIPTEGLIDTVDSISKTVINHQNKIEEQRVYNKNVKQQGLLQTELVNYNEQLKNEYSTGDISDEQLIGLFDKKLNTLYNKYKNEVYKDDEKAFKKWEGNFYIEMSQAREKMFAFKNSAIIGQAELTYQDADSQQQLNLSNTNPAFLNEDRYQTEYAVKKNALEILSKTQRVDIEKELKEFDAKYLQIALDGLIAPGANGKNSLYYEALADRLKITDKNQDGYVDKVGGKEISESERTALIDLSESNFLNQKKIEEAKEDKQINEISNTILERIQNDNNFTTNDKLFNQLPNTPSGKAQQLALKQILVDKQTNKEPDSLNPIFFNEMYQRVITDTGKVFEGKTAIDNEYTKFQLGDETKEEAKSFIERVGSQSLSFEQAQILRPLFDRKKKITYANEKEKFNNLIKAVEPRILGKLKKFNPNAQFRLISVILKLEKRFNEGLAKGITPEELTDPANKNDNFIYKDIDFDILTTMQESKEVRDSLKTRPEQISNIVGEARKPFFPPDMNKWMVSNIDLVKGKSSEEITTLYKNSKEFKEWENYAPFQTQYKEFLKKLSDTGK